MTFWIKSLTIHLNIPWRGPIVAVEYGHRKTHTCFWIFLISLRIFEKTHHRSYIYFRNYRKDYRFLTGRKMPLNDLKPSTP